MSEIKLLPGKLKALIEGCVAYTCGMKNKDFDQQRCVVLSYNAEKERWAIRLWEPRWQGKEILVQEGNLRFDLYVAKSPPPAPAGLKISAAGEGREDGVYADKDFKKDAVVMEDSPLMVVNNTTDGFTARWNAYFYEEREKGKNSPVLKCFEEITTGGMVEEYLEDAGKVFEKIVKVGCGDAEWKQMNADPKGRAFIAQETKKISGVLTRWQANSHDFPMMGNKAAKDSSGLFRWVSKINHSCEPNCVWNLDIATGKMVVKATKAIKKGDEVTCSYFGNDKEFMEKEFIQRRKQIKVMRYFTCTCTRCLREYEKHKKKVAAEVAAAKDALATGNEPERKAEESPEDFEKRVKAEARKLISDFETKEQNKKKSAEEKSSGGYPTNKVEEVQEEEEEDAPKICEVDDEEAERILAEKKKRQQK